MHFLLLHISQFQRTERNYREIKAPKVIDYEGLLKNTIIGCLTVVIDTKKVNDIKMPNLRTSQDLALWLSIMKHGTSHGFVKI